MLDQKKIRDVLARQQVVSQRSMSLDLLLADWALFVHRVAQGYDDTIYDYINELEVRAILYSISSKLTDEGKSKLQDAIHKADAQYRDATVEVKSALQAEAVPEQWWWYRLPKDLLSDWDSHLSASRRNS